jgi:hypothetical protein
MERYTEKNRGFLTRFTSPFTSPEEVEQGAQAKVESNAIYLSFRLDNLALLHTFVSVAAGSKQNLQRGSVP